MPSPRKYHPHRSVLFVTLSVEEGLLLLANPLCEAIVKSCLARAQALHPIRICHFVVQSTHVHLIIVVENPADVPSFVSRFKTESAHMINRVLGRPKRTVWCDGYDSPVVLSPTRALIAIAYLYANPAKDNLEDSIEQYPGLSSWRMFRDGVHQKLWKRLHRPAFRALTKDSHNLRGYTKEAARLDASSEELHTFRIEPNAWMEAFGITSAQEQQEINTRLVERVRCLEERARAKRKGSVMGRARLISRPIDKYYQPQRSGRRMWCLSESKALRRSFIGHLKVLIHEAKRIYRKWFVGDFSEPYPLGLYPPLMPKLAEPLTAVGW